jgi:hypothetical protein
MASSRADFCRKPRTAQDGGRILARPYYIFPCIKGQGQVRVRVRVRVRVKVRVRVRVRVWVRVRVRVRGRVWV